jgi:hypothetical protein
MLASAQCQAGRRGIHKQCSNTDFYKHLRSVTAACAFSAPQHEQLRSLFMSSPDNGGVFVHDEVAFTLWAFPPSDKAWFAVMQLLCKTLRPRVYSSAETRIGQKDAFMIVSTTVLKVGKHEFAEWIENFVDAIGMSAGYVCFDEYFGESMLSSLGRIVSGRHVYGNFRHVTSNSTFLCSHQRDFSTLFSTLTAQREDMETTRRITGMDLNRQNFVCLFQKNQRLVEASKTRDQQDRVWQTKRIALTRIVHALQRTHAINEDTKADMMQLLRVTALAIEECLEETVPAPIYFRRIHNPHVPPPFLTILQRTSSLDDENIPPVTPLLVA